MYKVGEDELVFCPYNRFHIVSKLRIQKHIIKCQKNYPDVKLATCFYNYTHRLRPEDMLKHYEICSQKTRIDGSRYSEPYCLTSSNASVKSDPYTAKFPDINVKPRVFTERGTFSSTSSHPRRDRDSDSSGSECVSDYPQLIGEDTGDDEDDDLEPLPLPKTISKAFVFVNQESNNFIPHTSQPKKFGRGKNFISFSPSENLKTSQHVPADHHTVESAKENKNEVPIMYSNIDSGTLTSLVPKCKSKSLCKSLPKDCTTVTSSMIDDISTLKSVDIISDDESTDEDNVSDGFSSTKFDT